MPLHHFADRRKARHRFRKSRTFESLERRELLAANSFIRGGFFTEGGGRIQAAPQIAVEVFEQVDADRATGTTASLTRVAQTTTDSTGSFSVGPLESGNYVVRPAVPAGFVQSTPLAAEASASTFRFDTGPVVMATGFWNRDSLPELFLVEESLVLGQPIESRLVVLGKPLDSLFEILLPVATIDLPSDVRSIEVADFNEDGLSDVAVTSVAGGGGLLTVLINDGAGGLNQSSSIAIGSRPRGLLAADFDGDGALDLAVANNQESTVSLFRGSPSGTFALASTVGSGPGPEELVALDRNRDGRADLFVSNLGEAGGQAGGFSSLENQSSPGDLRFSQPTTFSEGAVYGDLIVGSFFTPSDETGGGPTGIQIAALDLTSRSIDILDAGTLARLQRIDLSDQIGLNVAATIAQGDFDQDGDVDLAIAATNDGRLVHLVNLNRRTFARRITTDDLASSSMLGSGFATASGEFLGAGGVTSFGITIGINRGNKGGVGTTGNTMTVPIDFDGDGGLDLVAMHFDSSNRGHVRLHQTELVPAVAQIALGQFDNAPFLNFRAAPITLDRFDVRILSSSDRGGGGGLPVASRPRNPSNSTTQRSELGLIQAVFPIEITVPSPAEISLVNLGLSPQAGTPQAIVLRPDQLSRSDDRKTLLIDLDDHQTPDGLYRLTFAAGAVASNSLVFDNALSVLRGDFSGDGSVDIDDFRTFAYWSGFSVPVAPRFVDLDNSGTIDRGDFEILLNQSGKEIEFIGGIPKSGTRNTGRSSAEAALLARSLVTLQDPVDVNGDGQVTALDALNVINELARIQNRTFGSPRVIGWSAFNANEDLEVTAGDALFVINRLASGQASGEGEFAAIATGVGTGIDETIRATDHLFADGLLF